MGAIGGYFGRYLRVDVNAGTGQAEDLSADTLRRTIGGTGLGTEILVRQNSAQCEPLSPESTVVFSFSPLVGSPLTTSAKFSVSCKSPLTDRLNDSLASSGFAIAGKGTGFDAIAICGAASRPSLLLIDDGQVKMLDADDYWGLDCGTAQLQLRQKFGNDWQIAVIGPAGENLVRFATVSHDGRHAGRGGTGAVLGSKRVKAILVRGTQRCRWADPDRLYQYAKRLSERSFGTATAKYRELGTAANLLLFNRLKALPTRNFQTGSFAGAEMISPESLSLARERTRAYCAACTIGCEHIYSLGTSGKSEQSVRVEYENLFALGPLCGIDDPEIVLAASKKCDELGMDTISAGGTIAFAMECAERGLVDALGLKFGNGEVLLQLLDAIAFRHGLGNELAEGSRRFAGQVGGQSIRFAPQVKGLEIAGYEPRALQTMALGFAVSTRGADHNRSGAYEVDFSGQVDRRNLTRDSVALAIETEDKAALIDSLILCKFLRGIFPDLFVESAEMLAMVTGWEISAGELRSTCRRIVDEKKRFNIAAGWTSDEDWLPDRFFQESPADDPGNKLSASALSEAIQEYYRQRSWSASGEPLE